MTSPPRGLDRRTLADGTTAYRARVHRHGRRHVATFAAEADALAWRYATLAALDAGHEPPAPAAPDPPPLATGAPAVTVLAASERLLAGMTSGAIRTRDGAAYKPSVIRTYRESLRVDVLPRIGARPVADLTRGDVQRLADAIAAAKSPAIARKALTALRVVLRVAERYGDLEASPCVAIRVPADHERTERPARVLTPEDVAKIVQAADDDDARLKRSLAGPLFALLAGTGLRLGEALALTWGPDGLDLDAGLVRVRRSLDADLDEAGAPVYVATKSRAGRRDVPLAPGDAARLRRHRLAAGRPADGALVFHRDGAPLPQQTVPRFAFARACQAAKIAAPAPRIHDLRHAYATHALAAGRSAQAVARLLGHADAGLVLRRYGHALPDELATAGDALEAFRRARGLA